MTIRINTRIEWHGDEFKDIVDDSVDIGLGNVAAAGANLSAASMPGAGASAVPGGRSGRLRYSPSAPGQPPGVRTNRLRGSQVYDRLGKGRWAFGTNIFYAKFLERGTSRMPARPFLAPAFVKLRTRGQRIFTRAMSREMSRRLGRLG